MKKILMTLAAGRLVLTIAFCCAMTMSVLTACTDNDDNDDNLVPDPTVTKELPEEPTEDALTVQYDGNYVVYGQLEHGFDLALQRRMQGSMTSPMDADCFIFDMASLSQSSLSADEWKEMVRRSLSGEASYVITQCTFKEFYNFATIYVLTAMAIKLDNYQGDTDPSEQAEAMARAKQRMANVVRNAYVAGGQTDRAMTRSTQVNGQELDWENIDQWPAEKQNAIMFDAYAFCGGNDIYVLNAEASKYLNGEEADQPDTDYEWGQKADAIADWLNRQRKKDDAETRAGLADFSRAVTRAEGNNIDISKLMDAQTKDFVFDYKYPSLQTGGVSTAHSALKVNYYVYSAYDFAGNVEYYQVRQEMTVMNDEIFFDCGNNWWPRDETNPNKPADYYNLARGAWMKNVDMRMWLEGSGSKSIKFAYPQNENGKSSGSTSSGGSQNTTIGHTNGVSVGISGGVSAGKLMGSLTGSFIHTWTYSESTGTTWNSTTNWEKHDLTTKYKEENDENATVGWTITGDAPTTIDGTLPENIKELLKTTFVTNEQAVWKVDKPSGTYTLHASFNVVNEILKRRWVQFILKGEGEKNYYTDVFTSQDNIHDISFELNAPDRFKRMWNNVIYDYGNLTTFSETSELNKYINDTYGIATNDFCWATRFLTTEVTAKSSDNARSIFQTFKNSIRGMKKTLRSMKISGKVKFGLKVDGNEELLDSIVLDLDKMVYNEGETITENVNGYRQNFRVTKKNEEVELFLLPDFCVGKVIIPESICGNFLKVTSIGANCFYKQIGVTSVFIPSTVNNIRGDVFYNNNRISEIHVKATTPPAVAWDRSLEIRGRATLYVPQGCKKVYLETKYWKDFKNIVEE